jgi:hypothetical protein
MSAVTGSAAPEPMQEFLRAVGGRGDVRARAVFEVVDGLLAYRSARAALAGPALADWTERYEQQVRQLVVHGVDGVNDLFDTGSWPRMVRLLAASPRSVAMDELVLTVQAAIGERYGERAGEAASTATTLLAGSTVTTARTRGGVKVTLERDGQEPVSLTLTAQQEMGDQPRAPSSALFAARPPLVVQRQGGLRATPTNTDLGSVDFYGAFIAACQALVSSAQRDARTAKRFGRVRVEGEAIPIIVIIWLIALAVAAISTAIACAIDIQSDACHVLETITTVIGAIVGFALIAVLTASGGGTIPATGGVNFQGYNVNPPNYA